MFESLPSFPKGAVALADGDEGLHLCRLLADWKNPMDLGYCIQAACLDNPDIQLIYLLNVEATDALMAEFEGILAREESIVTRPEILAVLAITGEEE